MTSTEPDPSSISARTSWFDGQHDTRVRLRAGLISLVVGVGLLGIKFFAYHLTGSMAVLSDALESIVNVVAALFALSSLVFAGRPADRNHPYGHGKIEYFAAAFEGGLITFAALGWFLVRTGRATRSLTLVADGTMARMYSPISGPALASSSGYYWCG